MFSFFTEGTSDSFTFFKFTNTANAINYYYQRPNFAFSTDKTAVKTNMNADIIKWVLSCTQMPAKETKNVHCIGNENE